MLSDFFQFLIHTAFAQLAVHIDQNLQRHRAVSLRQHGFLVYIMFSDMFIYGARNSHSRCTRTKNRFPARENGVYLILWRGFLERVFWA